MQLEDNRHFFPLIDYTRTGKPYSIFSRENRKIKIKQTLTIS